VRLVALEDEVGVAVVQGLPQRLTADEEPWVVPEEKRGRDERRIGFGQQV